MYVYTSLPSKAPIMTSDYNTACAVYQGLNSINPDTGDTLCPSDYLPGGPQYDSTMQAFCSTNLDNPACYTDYCLSHPCENEISTYCTQGSNADSLPCKFLCFSNLAPYDCGFFLESYCQKPENSSLETCQCYLPSTAYQKYYQKRLADLPDPTKDFSYTLDNNEAPACTFPPCSYSYYRPRIAPQCNQAECLSYLHLNVDKSSVFTGPLALGAYCSYDVKIPDQNIIRSPFVSQAPRTHLTIVVIALGVSIVLVFLAMVLILIL